MTSLPGNTISPQALGHPSRLHSTGVPLYSETYVRKREFQERRERHAPGEMGGREWVCCERRVPDYDKVFAGDLVRDKKRWKEEDQCRSLQTEVDSIEFTCNVNDLCAPFKYV